MEFTKPLDKQLREIGEHYPEALEYAMDFLRKKRIQQGLIGDNTDETLTRVYKQAGYFEALSDLLTLFRS